MKIIAIANQKGGCGKTTTAVQLAAILGEQGRRVLLIDMDPQGHATLGLGQANTGLPGLFEVMQEKTTLQQTICRDLAENLDLLPATISLGALERMLDEASGRERWLLDQLLTLPEDYDRVIIDCPPALGLLSINALRAAQLVLVPVDLSLFALDGLERLRETLRMIETRCGLDLPLVVLPNMFSERTRLARTLLDGLREWYGERLLQTRIRATVKLREAAYRGRPLTRHARTAPVTEDFRALAREIEERLASVSAIQPRPVLWEPRTHAGTDPEGVREIVLHYGDLDGHQVQIAGSFNDWTPDKDVETRQDEGGLTKVLRLPPGEYEYRLIVDGRWQEDPTNPQAVPNALGERNSLLRV